MAAGKALLLPQQPAALTNSSSQRKSISSIVVPNLGCGSQQRRVSSCSQCTKMTTTPCGQGIGAKVQAGEYIGILDVFKVGIGPSSSHTMGPMWAGKKFVESLTAAGVMSNVTKVAVDLYGSLALTGKGHATDKATVLGLAGFQPDTINPDAADATFDEICRSGLLRLNGVHDVAFDFPVDLVFHTTVELPYHPNGMTIRAMGVSDLAAQAVVPTTASTGVILSETYYSIGGGFIDTESEFIAKNGLLEPHYEEEQLDNGLLEASPRSSDGEVEDELASAVALLSITAATPQKIPFFFNTAEELLQLCRRHNLSIAEIMMENECVHRNIDRTELYGRMDHLADVIDACVERGLRVEGRMPVSQVPRRAAGIKKRLTQCMEKSLQDPLFISDWIALYARAVNEENACGGRVVTAPTNGAAGTVPAVLTYYRRSISTATAQGTRDFIATAAAIGSLCKRNASISGAEAGCQAEVGSACAMAAAGLCAVLGGTPPQIENAAEIGLEHCLGMTCDPIMGLVQIPCIERNCVAAIKAVMGCRLALLGDGEHEVSLDSCIETMYRTGLDIQTKYRETSTGGLALFAKKMMPFQRIDF